MKIRQHIKTKILLILLTPIVLLLNLISGRFPILIENIYSLGINRYTIQFLSRITGVFGFSFGEILFFVFILTLIILVVRVVVLLFDKNYIAPILDVFAYLSIIYVLFMLLWGFNYNRVPFEQVVGLTIQKSSTDELKALCEDLINKANSLREQMPEDSNGVAKIEGGYKNVFSRSQKAYDNLSISYKELEGKYGIPKPVLLSEKLLYTGITGIYIPYTGEANVNIKVEDYTLPATTLHEMAHQRGYAKEDEANYIAYLASMAHDDVDFQYSGVMLALTYSMNALADNDLASYRQVASLYSAGVRRDINYSVKLWRQYEGKVETVATNINDTYLKSNGQSDGVNSYGKMVDLLLAQYRK